MEIKSINNINFGKIYISEETKPKLTRDILRNKTHNAEELKEALATLIDIAESKDRDIFIGKRGTISYTIPELNGKRYQDKSRYSISGQLIHALSRMRSNNLQNQIAEHKRAPQYY